MNEGKPKRDVIEKLLIDYLTIAKHSGIAKTKNDIRVSAKAFLCGLKICCVSMEKIIDCAKGDRTEAEKNIKDFQQQVDWYFENKV